ncbi:MAG: CPBP family intramembrane metalloprotease [Ruminococcus sp.]|nr:CPBP family intramembrane metalloprotease [Ruminococcus sp.]MCM1382518.1 CPBP family intramembrane metalloprotease [Muribaculaceae bacterium]MCM1478921.1 CPBP family intramembrane metalloprotease [Muribaculaceae bacterium]
MNKKLACFGVSVVILLAIFSGLYYYYRKDIFLTILMLTPAASVIITRLATKEGFADLYLKPNFKGNLKWYLLAYFGTPVAAYVGAAVYFLIFGNDWQPLMSQYALETGAETTAEYFRQLALTIPLAVLINPIMGLVQCLGEEFAWRGYLLPKLTEKFSYRTAVVINGIIWGLWHTPVIVTGFNYGSEHPVLGVLAMTAHCVILGIIASFLFSKTGSVWCPVVFHAALNAMDKFSPAALFMGEGANPFIGPNLGGLVGGIGFTVIAVIIFIKYVPEKNSLEVKI